MPPIDWLNSPIESNVSEILARKRRAKAIETLREQLEGKAPSEKVRLQLADLLIQAGRPNEACPILLALVDELRRDGFVAKAIAILKRVEKVDPGRADVAERMAALVEEQSRQAAAASTATPTPRPAPAPLFGIEEIGDAPGDETLSRMAVPDFTALPPEIGGPLPPDEAAAGPAPAPPAPATAEVPPPPAQEAAEARAEEPEAEPVPEPEPEAEPVPEPEAPAEPAKPAGGRLRSVFRRFLSSLVDDEKPAEPPAPAPEQASAPEPEAAEAPASESAAAAPQAREREAAGPDAAEESGIDRFKGALRGFLTREDEVEPRVEPEPEAEATIEVESSPPPETVVEAEAEPDSEPASGPTAEPEPIAEAVPEPVPEPAPAIADAAEAADEEVEPSPEVEPEAEDEAPPESLIELLPEPEGSEGLDEAEFHDQLLDLVQDVLKRPGEPVAKPVEPEIDALDEEAHPVRVDARHYLEMSRRLLATPLFGDLEQDELMAVVEGLTLRTWDPGDVLVSEGAPGNSLFLLTTGELRVYVRNPVGRNVEVARLLEGDWFGEVSALSGRPRSATVVAADWVECLELSKPTLDAMAAVHPRVRDRLEAAYIARASSPANAAVRAVALDAENTRRRATEVLLAHFGASQWDPKMQLRLADALLRAGKEEDAVAVLVGLADELVRGGFPEKAIAILKKIEGLQRRYVEEVNLAPLKRPRATAAEPAPAPPAPAPPPVAPAPARGPRTEASFADWLVDVVRDQVQRTPTLGAQAAPAAARSYDSGLRGSPLFEGFTEEELLALVQQLRLVPIEPGEILISEGEPGGSLFILATGVVKVFVRTPRGHDARLAVLRDGAFFGEMAALSGGPRRATVIASTRGELLELTREALEACTASHPRMREVLEAFARERAQSAEAAQLRGQPPA
ncbi:MAG: cyclic nucleotide-binding domain-containing protein [Vicinamibacteria bacterium]|nr:cyclic nucleotide-binding domain-containing protein [Vicinamibacteria bacterium]MCL4821377.1 cyclic nucleotide-binding domain-containing protein [Vicinamibacteria bacterium]